MASLAMAQQAPPPNPDILQKKLAWEQREHATCTETLVNFVQQYEDAKKQIDDLQKQMSELRAKLPGQEEEKK
jgi:predicted  nucleic acid-binding Zn-ribbon protein